MRRSIGSTLPRTIKKQQGITMGMWRGLASPADGSGTPVDPGRSPGRLHMPTALLGRPEGTGRARACSVRGISECQACLGSRRPQAQNTTERWGFGGWRGVLRLESAGWSLGLYGLISVCLSRVMAFSHIYFRSFSFSRSEFYTPVKQKPSFMRNHEPWLCGHRTLWRAVRCVVSCQMCGELSGWRR